MSILTIKQANCKNCYRCVRVCPVKAIIIKDGQATVDEECCILCGQCLTTCPQEAKKVENSLEYTRNLLYSKRKVILSLAPSFVSHFTSIEPGQLKRTLLGCGFFLVEETAVGAQAVSQYYARLLKHKRADLPLITSCCPSVNYYICKYYPSLVKHLMPVVSPMIAHARMLQKRYGRDVHVVFAGPCLAKKHEMLEVEVAGSVSAVLTFTELEELIDEMCGSVSDQSPWSENMSLPARAYPITGGVLSTLPKDRCDYISASGIDEVADICLAVAQGKLSNAVIEANMCPGGCINGPFVQRDEAVIVKRRYIQAYTNTGAGSVAEPSVPLQRVFHPAAVGQFAPTEEQIREVLTKIGKHGPADEYNCGACGYDSCREKAVAVLQGRAELEMCMPYMRERAESLANLVMEVTPNSIIVVDENLKIIEFNKAAERLFNCQTADVIGHSIAKLMPVEHFEAVKFSEKAITGKRVVLEHLQRVTVQTIKPVPQAKIIVAVIADVTEQEKQAQELARIRQETIAKAQEVIMNQMRVAHEIASLLGETTAESKMLLTKLIRLVEDGDSR